MGGPDHLHAVELSLENPVFALPGRADRTAGDRSGEIDPYRTFISSTACEPGPCRARRSVEIGVGDARRGLIDKIQVLNAVPRTSACLGATAVDGSASGVKEYWQVTVDFLTRFVFIRLGIAGMLPSARRD